MSRVARIFEEPTGLYHYSDDALPYLDARGPGYWTKATATRAAAADGYTHAIGLRKGTGLRKINSSE